MKEVLKDPFISGLVEGHVDVKVYQDIIKTHAKESISFLDYGNLSITNIDQRVISRVQFTECEISPFHHHDIECKEHQTSFFSRMASTPQFAAKRIAFSDIENLLINAFSPHEDNRRPYPSAGGLYPVEPLVFLFADRITHEQEITSGAYHFRPLSKCLQLLKRMESEHFFNKLLHGLLKPSSFPCLAILYIAHIGKAIFKYRYRGYRHAAMEAGSMYQHAQFVAQHLGLRNTIWSSFSEHEMLYALDLDYGSFLPLTMQLFGYEE